MQNPSIINFTKNKLKHLIKKCSNEQQLIFKRIYSPTNLNLDINVVIDNMDPSKLDWALTQVERTLEKHESTNTSFVNKISKFFK